MSKRFSAPFVPKPPAPSGTGHYQGKRRLLLNRIRALGRNTFCRRISEDAQMSGPTAANQPQLIWFGLPLLTSLSQRCYQTTPECGPRGHHGSQGQQTRFPSSSELSQTATVSFSITAAVTCRSRLPTCWPGRNPMPCTATATGGR